MKRTFASAPIARLFFLLWLGLPVHLLAQAPAEPGFICYLNGEPVSREVLHDQVLCTGAGDSLRIEYAGGVSEYPFLLTGLNAVGQLNLGRPTVLLQRAYSQPGPRPAYTLGIRELVLHQRLPDADGAIRVVITLGQVAQVSGRRVVELSEMSQDELTISFLLTQACE